MGRTARPALRLGGAEVAAGRRGQVQLPIARLISGSEALLPVRVLHGPKEGPTIWLSAAIHGDEVNGVEIIRRVLQRVDLRSLRGTVLAVPVVNVYGFMNNDRYFPDRRDLNRSFPGSARGSLASRVAHLMMSQIVSRCDVGIDLHTGSDNRTNLPHVRCRLDDARTRELALAFGTSVVVNARDRDGSLRQAAGESGATVLVYEGGEASRYDEDAIAVGVDGVLRVMAHLQMTAPRPAPDVTPLEISRTVWVRAPRSGILLSDHRVGDRVERGELLARVADATGQFRARITAPRSGLLIGRRLHPIANQGDAVFHIAESPPPSPPGDARHDAPPAGGDAEDTETDDA